MGESHGRVTNFVQSCPTSSQIPQKKKASKMEKGISKEKTINGKKKKKKKTHKKELYLVLPLPCHH